MYVETKMDIFKDDTLIIPEGTICYVKFVKSHKDTFKLYGKEREVSISADILRIITKEINDG